MAESNAIAVALSLALLIPQGVSAQVASRLEAGALVTTRDGEIPISRMNLSPAVKVDLPLLTISATGSAWLTGQDWQIASGTVSASLLTPTFHGLRAELLTHASHALDSHYEGSDEVDAQARVHLLHKDRGGIWVGAGAARPWRVAVVSSVDVSGAGAWTRFGGATLSGTFTNFAFTKVAAARYDSTGGLEACSQASESGPVASMSAPANLDIVNATGECRRYSHFSDLEGSVHWQLGALEFDAQSGYRFGNSYDVTADSRRWAAATATFWLTDRLAAVLGGGRVPASPSRGLPARSFANFGMMVAYSPISRTVPVIPRVRNVTAFESRPGNSGLQRFVARIGGVESVDVMGDFSDWQPLTLIRRGRDLWELSLPALSSGVHQINVRVDGGPWVAPPGLPTMKDGFGGETAILIVP